MQIQLDTLYNMDCLEGMKHIPDGSVDAIICDLPYGTMKGAMKWEAMGWEGNKHEWDTIIPSEPLFEQYERVLRRGGVAVLFSQEPYTSHLRTFRPRNMSFCYPMIWKKDSAGNALNAKNAPLGYFEDINVFTKDHDSTGVHPLRDYGKKVCEYIGKTPGQVQDDFREWNIPTPTRAQHFLSYDAVQYTLCTAETYDLLIEHYHIDQMPGFRTYDSLTEENDRYKEQFAKTFNLPDGCQSMSNVLEFRKTELSKRVHPTQKPVGMLGDILKDFSKESDIIIDCFGGSGSTLIACEQLNRKARLMELDPHYCDVIIARWEKLTGKKAVKL